MKWAFLQKVIFLVGAVGSVQYDDERRMNDVQPSILNPVDFTTPSIWSISPSLSTQTIPSELAHRQLEGLYFTNGFSPIDDSENHQTGCEFAPTLEAGCSDFGKNDVPHYN